MRHVKFSNACMTHVGCSTKINSALPLGYVRDTLVPAKLNLISVWAHHRHGSNFSFILSISPQKWTDTLSQQEALLELQAWLEDAKSCLEERRSRISQSSSTSADLSQLLKDCKVKHQDFSVFCQWWAVHMNLTFILSRSSLSGESGRDVGSSGHSGLCQPDFTDLQYRGGSQGALWREPVCREAGQSQPWVAQFAGSPQLSGRKTICKQSSRFYWIFLRHSNVSWVSVCFRLES